MYPTNLNYGIIPEEFHFPLSGLFSGTTYQGIMVPVYAFGPSAEKFGGIYDNTALFQKFIASYGFGELK